MPKPITAKIRLMLVEDNPVHQRFTQRAIEGAELDVELHISADGIEALDYLKVLIEQKPDAQPDFILLDLNMPRMGGLELLGELKKHPQLRSIPVAVLSTSEAPNDIRDAYMQGANAYLAKPGGYHEFCEMLREFGRFWLHRARLPRHGR
jgi:CheY-like chemotaxis protein